MDNREIWALKYRIQDHQMLGYCSHCEDYSSEVSVACWEELNRQLNSSREPQTLSAQETLKQTVHDCDQDPTLVTVRSVRQGMTEETRQELLANGWCERVPGGSDLFLTEAGFREGYRLLG